MYDRYVSVYTVFTSAYVYVQYCHYLVDYEYNNQAEVSTASPCEKHIFIAGQLFVLYIILL